MVKVSVIVPVYNAEKYLRKCLDTLVNQTLADIEIVLVNDGSTDNSKSILEEYQNNYPNKVNFSSDYILNPKKSMFDDTNVFKFVDSNTIQNAVFGSKKYLEMLFYMRQNMDNKSNLKSIFRSYVNLNTKLNYNISENSLKLLNKLMLDKKFYIEGKNLLVIDSITNERISFNYLSSGEKKIIDIINALEQTDENTIILFDEPDLSLSIYWQEELIKLIENNFKSFKLIIATQSPYLVDKNHINNMIPIYYED